jgi:RNA processing factor Prp31
MQDVAPNLTCILGESIGAKLLTQAGGLTNLAKLPSSTI